MKLSDKESFEIRLKIMDKFRSINIAQIAQSDWESEDPRYRGRNPHDYLMKHYYPFVEKLLTGKVSDHKSTTKTHIRELLEDDCPELFKFIWDYAGIKEIEAKLELGFFEDLGEPGDRG